MTNATTTVIARVAAVVAGLGLVAASFAPIASAQTSTTTTTTTTTSATFSRDLTLGSTGADVTALQNWLISKGHTIAAGATGYFGAQTRAALAAWQAANGITPAAGYFGPITRAKVASTGGSTGGNTGGSNTGDLKGGEASIESLKIKDGEEDEVEEGMSAEVAKIEFDVEDGDIRIDRVDLKFTTPTSGASETDPWDAFDTITLMADGKEIASEDVSDEDEWLDEDNGVFRFTGLDYVVRDGDTANIVVEVEAQDGVLDTNDTADTWTITIEDEGIRGTDAAGIQQYSDGSDSLTFDLVEEGVDDELTVRSSSEDPDATTLIVEDTKRSDWYTVFVFDLEADEDGSDIEINNLPVRFFSSDSDVTTVINDVKVSIDGEEFDDTVGNIGTTTTFDIDGDFTVDAGDRVAVEVMVQFKGLTGNYAEGATLYATTTGALITAEGADDVTPSGSATSETHTLRTSGIDVSLDEKSAVATSVDGADNDYATFKVSVDVTAFEDDAFISATGTQAFTYQIENASSGEVLSLSGATTTNVVSSTADMDGNSYRISEGDTETFTFTVTLDPTAANESQSYRMQLLSIVFGTTNAATGSSWTALPASTYETQSVLIQD